MSLVSRLKRKDVDSHRSEELADNSDGQFYSQKIWTNDGDIPKYTPNSNVLHTVRSHMDW